MLIGEFAKATGLPRDTIRFYEKIGLIGATETRRGANRYKHYDRALLGRMELVRKAKLLGFGLTEIGKLIRAWESNKLSPKEKQRIVADKIVAVDQKLRELRQVRRYLAEKLAGLCGATPTPAKTRRADRRKHSAPRASG